MRKLLFIFLLLPCLAPGQTAMVLQMSVRRIPVTESSGSQCNDERVLFFSQGSVMGILTPDDTLQLKRVAIEVSEPGHSIIVCYDELHGNQPYRVRYIEGKEGILIYITPFVTLRDSERRALWNVRIKPAEKVLYGLVISTNHTLLLTWR